MTGEHPRLAQTATLRAVVLSLERGDLANATSLACAALDRGETHPLLLNLRASRFDREGNGAAALADLLRAHELDPDDVGGNHALGLQLMKFGRFVEAIRAYDDALRVAPEFPGALFNKGVASEAAGYLDSARQCYETAIDLDPNQAEPFARLASLAARRGAFGEAIRRAREALARQPENLAALQALIQADIAEGRPADAELRIQELLGRPNLSSYDRYLTMGSLGELRERQRRFSDAYAAFAGGNGEYYRAERPRFGQTGTALSAIRWLIEACSRPERRVSSQRADDGGASRIHVFLLGFPRSGTTLLEQALASHPEVVTMEEKDAFAESVRAFMANPGDHARLARLDSTQLEPYRRAYWARVAEFGFSPNARVFVDKHPFHTIKLPLIAALFPKAKVLFALRDPRDAVLGCLRARFRMNPYMIELLRPEDAARFYAAYMQLAELYRASLPLNICEVRHERLVADFDAVARDICAFIGIAWHPAMRDFGARQQIRAAATPGARHLAGGLSRAGIGRWRNYATELAPLLPILAPWVEKFGYGL